MDLTEIKHRINNFQSYYPNIMIPQFKTIEEGKAIINIIKNKIEYINNNKLAKKILLVSNLSIRINFDKFMIELERKSIEYHFEIKLLDNYTLEEHNELIVKLKREYPYDKEFIKKYLF